MLAWVMNLGFAASGAGAAAAVTSYPAAGLYRAGRGVICLLPLLLLAYAV